MIDLKPLHAEFAGTALEPWLIEFEKQFAAHLSSGKHGDLPKWQAALDALPDLKPGSIDLNASAVRIGNPEDGTPAQLADLERNLRQLLPWRKGPFQLFGTEIDTEWRSDWKWDRLRDEIEPLEGRRVLDVGCGSGYHCWRMAGAGARFVLGIDPSLLFLSQFLAVQTYARQTNVAMLPCPLEELPDRHQAFDSVFSMGVLYHRRSPIDHLTNLRDCLRPGGELILETLIIEGGQNEALVPEGRYARMRNVWFIPTIEALQRWMQRAGFRNIRCIDVTATTCDEQRSTDWMQFESLEQCLDPKHPGRTIEGLPGPLRAICMANAP